MIVDSSEDTVYAVAYLSSQTGEYSADLSLVIGNCRVARKRHLSKPRLEPKAAVKAVRLKEQIVDTQLPSYLTGVCGKSSS